MSAAIATASGKTILIACHKPPPYHNSLKKINMTELKKNRTRKNKNLTENGNTVFYLNTNTSNISKTSPSTSYFSNWESIPNESIDVIWSQHCPYLGPFFKENMHDIREGNPLLEDNPSEAFWKTALEHAHRILKPGGSFILPLKPVWSGFLSDPSSVLYTFRIINQEVYPQYLYRVNWVSSLYKLPFFLHSSEHNLFETHDNSNTRLVHVDEWGFIVIQRKEA